MRKIAFIALAVATAVAAEPSLAQRMPGRDRGDSPRESQKRDRETRSTPAAAWQDPFSALERELPSLKVDLRLTAEQVEPWSLFERDVRDLAQLERTRRRHLLALRDPDGQAPSARQLISTIAEEERHETQQRVIDRRVVLSQAEPLSQAPSAPRR